MHPIMDGWSLQIHILLSFQKRQIHNATPTSIEESVSLPAQTSMLSQVTAFLISYVEYCIFVPLKSIALQMRQEKNTPTW